MIANQVIESCESTNNLARQLGEAGYPHGTWVSARSQTRGRGRLGREWRSLEGNLFLSILVRPESKALWTWVPLAAATATAEALVDLFPGLPARVKWPNDLWIGGKKLGGILCEAIGSNQDSFVVIGIGLNCAAAPGGLDQPTTSLSTELNQRISADDVRSAIIRRVSDGTEELDTAKISSSYEAIAAFPAGTPIQWADGAESGSVLGLGLSGELKVVRPSGEVVPLFAEDVKIRA